MTLTEVSEPVRIDQAQFRNVLGHFCSGITVISSHDGVAPAGMTCQSFFSLSLDPALIALAVGRRSTTYPTIRSVGSLVVNVLASDQQEISTAFARSGTDKWRGIPWTPGTAHGNPVIDGIVASLECEIDNEIECGDHLLIVARVINMNAEPSRQPLLYFQGAYGRLHSPGGPDAS